MAGAFEGCGAKFSGRQGCCRHSADHAYPQDERLLVRRDAELNVPGSDKRHRFEVGNVPDGADERAVHAIEREALGNGRSDCERTLRACARVWQVRGKRAVGGDPQGEGIARNMALKGARGCAGLLLGSLAQRLVGFANAGLRNPHQGNADRKQCGSEDQQQLCRCWQGCKPLGGGPAHGIGCRITASAELSEEIEEVVGNRFAQRVVINRAQRSADVAGPLPARLFFAGVSHAGVLTFPSALLLAFLTATQTLVPLARVRRASYSELDSARNVFGHRERNTFGRGPVAAPSTPNDNSLEPEGKPNGRCFVPVPSILWG